MRVGKTDYNVANVVAMGKEAFLKAMADVEAQKAKAKKGYTPKTKAHFEDVYSKCLAESKKK